MHHTHHLVHPEAVIELQGRNVVGLLKIVNHQEFSVVQTSCGLEELLETFLDESFIIRAEITIHKHLIILK